MKITKIHEDVIRIFSRNKYPDEHFIINVLRMYSKLDIRLAIADLIEERIIRAYDRGGVEAYTLL